LDLRGIGQPEIDLPDIVRELPDSDDYRDEASHG
jgi:hypothetical protein